MNTEIIELQRQLTLLTRRVDELVKPEVPLGLSLIAPPQILTGTAASITFSDISQSYRHLLLKCQVRTDRAASEVDGVLLRFNGDSSAIYDRQSLIVNNATLTGAAARAQTSIQIGASEAASSRANNFSPTEANIYGYARTDNEKWTLSYNANFGDVSADADLFIRYFGGRWRSTAAITSITLLPNVGPNFVTGSEFQLYGVR